MNLKHPFFAAALLVSTLSLGQGASVTVTTGGSSPSATTDTSATASAPVADTAAPVADTAVPGTVVAPASFPIHFRWGINPTIGYFFPAGMVDFGGNLRFGAQISELIGVFLDGGFTVGFGLGGNFSGTAGSVSVSILAFWHLAPMVEFDFDKFFVAVGPLFGSGAWVQVSQGVDVSGTAFQQAIAVAGFMPGADIRVGFTFGDRQDSGFLSGFTLALDLKILNGAATEVSQSAGTGGAAQGVSVGDRVWGFTPMLMLGYDLR